MTTKAELEARLDELQSRYWQLNRRKDEVDKELKEERQRREMAEQDLNTLRRDLALAQGWVHCKLDRLPGGQSLDEIHPEFRSGRVAYELDEPWKR